MATSAKVGMPRSTVGGRRAASASSWSSLPCAPVGLTWRPSTSPSRPSRSASAIRAIRLSRRSISRDRWAGSGRRSEHLTQACSWMQGDPKARAYVPTDTFRFSKWERKESPPPLSGCGTPPQGGRYSTCSSRSHPRGLDAHRRPLFSSAEHSSPRHARRVRPRDLEAACAEAGRSSQMTRGQLAGSRVERRHGQSPDWRSEQGSESVAEPRSTCRDAPSEEGPLAGWRRSNGP